jgi:hypothetical protein
LVHRSSALKATTGRSKLTLVFLMAIVAIGTLEFRWLYWFLLEPLPNAGNVGGNGLCRLHILIRSLPEVFIAGLKYRESYLGLALAELSHFENLPQRVPIVLAAMFIAGSAIATGNLVLRGLRVRPILGHWERLAVGYGLGTTAIGLATLLVGRLGLLNPWLIRVGLAVPIAVELFQVWRGREIPDEPNPAVSDRWSLGSILGFAAVAGPFLLIMALGAMLPTVDFDAIEYHLQGPKEYFQAGRIAFLPHNVYTSMPFSIEMLHLLGMEVVGDWWLGALVGQLLIASFAPASAVLIGLTAQRLGSPRAGWIAVVVYLTTPWIYRLAVLPYVEGPLCYFHAALIWAVVRSGSLPPCGGGLGWGVGRRALDGRKHWFRTPMLVPRDPPPQPSPARGEGARIEASPAPRGLGFLVGLLAGGAMATKYPALISAVIPFSGWAAWASWRERNWRIAVGYAVGVALVMAPWLAKNVIDTGNPVYPLAYKVFGGSHWDPASDAKWSAAHGPKPVEAGAFVQSVVDVAGRSDWQSPLYAALAPLAFLRPGSRRASGWLAAFSVYLFLTWWLLTHRLDRFWLPILPPLAILAGVGADWVRSKLWVALLSVVLGVSIATNAVYSSTALAGLNEWTGDLIKLKTGVPRMLNPPLARLDAELPAGARPLLVGQAAVFHLNRPIVYNTVFNNEIIETIVKGRTPDQVRQELRRLGVTHIYVDWFEVERYRSPGNYGFTPFVTPEVFNGLVLARVLKPPRRMGLRQELYEVDPSNPALQ